MGIRSLANAYRPKKFDAVVGQEDAVRILSNSILRQRLYGSYLIEGPFGTGKTTLARIFSKRLLCEHPQGVDSCEQCASCKAFDTGSNPNYREVDAATHSGVDSVRRLQEFARTGALGGAGRKVIVVDEAHDLSTQAQDVLLKLLEEAREGLTFVLCTTAGDDILNTVRSRSVVCGVVTPPFDEVVKRLEWIAQQEGISVEPEALRLIASQTHLHLRDAIKELEVLSLTSGDKITRAQVAQHYGLGSYDEVLQFLCSLASKPLEAVDLAFRVASQRGVPHFYRLTKLVLADVLAVKFRQPSIVRVLDPVGDLAAINTIASAFGRRIIMLSQFIIEATQRSMDWETLFADVLYANAIITQDIVFKKSAQASMETVTFENQRDAEEMNRLLADPQKLYQVGRRKPVKPDPVKAKSSEMSEGDFIEELWQDADGLESRGWGREVPPPPPPEEDRDEEDIPPPPPPGEEGDAEINAAIDRAAAGSGWEEPPPPPPDEAPPPPPESGEFDSGDPLAGCFPPHEDD